MHTVYKLGPEYWGDLSNPRLDTFGDIVARGEVVKRGSYTACIRYLMGIGATSRPVRGELFGGYWKTSEDTIYRIL